MSARLDLQESTVVLLRLLSSSRGQGLVEYALIIFLVAIAAMVILGTLGGKIKLVFTSVTGSL